MVIVSVELRTKKQFLPKSPSPTWAKIAKANLELSCTKISSLLGRAATNKAVTEAADFKSDKSSTGPASA